MEGRRAVAVADLADLSAADCGRAGLALEALHRAGGNGAENLVVVAAGEKALEHIRVGGEDGAGGLGEWHARQFDTRRGARHA